MLKKTIIFNMYFLKIREAVTMNKLPLTVEVETLEIYKNLATANYVLGELNGLLNLLPNPNIILNAFSLREAKDSSEIENIVTTYDELFNALGQNDGLNYNEKEVLKYKRAITFGHNELLNKGFINTNSLINIQKQIEDSSSGIRKMPGTVIMNPKLKKVVYTPLQTEEEILYYLKNLEDYINMDTQVDPLIDLAIVHFQFESIHPFYDANGRTGRILNILFLVLKEKLSYPILYLSKYINETKEEYYKLLRMSNEDIHNIQDFIIYMIKGIEITAEETIVFINAVVKNMEETNSFIKDLNRNYYNPNLVDFLYSNFYITIDLYKDKYEVTRQTASTHLNRMVEDGILFKETRGKNIVYTNVALKKLMLEW